MFTATLPNFTWSKNLNAKNSADVTSALVIGLNEIKRMRWNTSEIYHL